MGYISLVIPIVDLYGHNIQALSIAEIRKYDPRMIAAEIAFLKARIANL